MTSPFRKISEAFRLFTSNPPALPDALAALSPSGKNARELLTQLPLKEQETLGEICSKKLHDGRWIKNRQHREAAKVILAELSVSAVGTAQELGLTFASKLNRVSDPWMRILVHLEVAELLARERTFAPSCALAYRQTFEHFSHYLDQGLYARGDKKSLFEPLANAKGDSKAARLMALEAVLPYGEDALRLFWGLQAQHRRDGNSAGFKAIRHEEKHLADKLSAWMDSIPNEHYIRRSSWYEDLHRAVEVSKAGRGHTIILGSDTPRSRAVGQIIQEISEFIELGDYRRADTLLVALRESLRKHPELEISRLKEHLLYTGYLRSILLYRSAMRSELTPAETAKFRGAVLDIFRNTEVCFHEPGKLWSKSLALIRQAAIRELPVRWRERLPEMPI